ncbi:MAG: thiolase family protein [Dehalococcoidia bacterium]
MATRLHNGDVVIGLGFRTPAGKQHGMFASLEPYELMAAVLRRQLNALQGIAGVDRVLAANATNLVGNVARVSSLAAGLPVTIPAMTVNAQCSSGLAAVRAAFEAVAAGACDLVLAGGVESATHAAVQLGAQGSRRGERAGSAPRISHAPAPFSDPEMGPAADNLAARLGIGREALDSYAYESYRRHDAAKARGFFAPLSIPNLTSGSQASPHDEMPRSVPVWEHLVRYPSAFTEGGATTAGNCAAAADGAAGVAIGREQALAAAGEGPMARVLGAVTVAGDPAFPAFAAVHAVERLLRQTEVSVGAIDRWEINEAFAAKVVAVMRHFGLAHERVNVNGGAIAYGHPFAASGVMLLVHLIAELHASGSRYGVAAIAGAGGIGEAMLIGCC